MQITRDELAVALSNSGIMTYAELESFEAKLRADLPPNDGESLAQELVREYKLTEYQRDVLCKDARGPLSLDDYVILDKIGEGGMGVVYKAFAPPQAAPGSSEGKAFAPPQAAPGSSEGKAFAPPQAAPGSSEGKAFAPPQAAPKSSGETVRRERRSVVALKVLPPALSDDEGAIRRFQREVELAARLKHANIVAAIGSGTVDGQLYFVMEFVDGKNLSVIVKQQKNLSLLTAFDYVWHAALGLEYAHNSGVIHRDIKPANLLRDRDGTVKILDMGLARVKSTSDTGDSVTLTDLTLSGAVLGTADYMSPEQALNAKRADHRSDIYSLGCTMHFIFTGHPMYDGETIMEKLVAHREHPVPSLMDRRDDVPSGVDEIFRKMVAKDPDDRYATASELVQAIQGCREEYGNMWMIRRFIDEQKGRRLL